MKKEKFDELIKQLPQKECPAVIDELKNSVAIEADLKEMCEEFDIEFIEA